MTVHVQSDYAQLPERRLEVQSLKNGMEALLGSGQNQPTGHQIQLISDMFVVTVNTANPPRSLARRYDRIKCALVAAFHSMVLLEDTIAVYGGFSPFCYEYCKDVWQLNL